MKDFKVIVRIRGSRSEFDHPSAEKTIQNRVEDYEKVFNKKKRDFNGVLTFTFKTSSIKFGSLEALISILGKLATVPRPLTSIEEIKNG